MKYIFLLKGNEITEEGTPHIVELPDTPDSFLEEQLSESLENH